MTKKRPTEAEIDVWREEEDRITGQLIRQYGVFIQSVSGESMLRMTCFACTCRILRTSCSPRTRSLSDRKSSLSRRSTHLRRRSGAVPMGRRLRDPCMDSAAAGGSSAHESATRCYTGLRERSPHERHRPLGRRDRRFESSADRHPGCRLRRTGRCPGSRVDPHLRLSSCAGAYGRACRRAPGGRRRKGAHVVRGRHAIRCRRPAAPARRGRP